MARKKTVEVVEATGEIDAIQAELDAFIAKNVGVPVEQLGQRDFADSFIDTGNLAFNFILSHKMRTGGIAKNKIFTFEGERERGKSVLSTLLATNNIVDEGITYYNDVEDGLNIDFARKASSKSGIEDIAGKINIVVIRTLEEMNKFMNKIADFNAAKKEKDRKHILVMVDSWSILTSLKEDAESIKDDVGKKARDMTKAVEARALIRTFTSKMREANISFGAVLHTTSKIGVMFGSPETQAAHGTALQFGASQSVKVMATKEIKKREADLFAIGVRLHVKIVKNRVVHKGKEAYIDVYFAGEKMGLDRTSGLAQLLDMYDVANLSCDWKKISKSAKLTWMDPRTGEEHTFQAAKIDEFIEENGGDELIDLWEEQLCAVLEDREANIPESAFDERIEEEDEPEETVET